MNPRRAPILLGAPAAAPARRIRKRDVTAVLVVGAVVMRLLYVADAESGTLNLRSFAELGRAVIRRAGNEPHGATHAAGEGLVGWSTLAPGQTSKAGQQKEHVVVSEPSPAASLSSPAATPSSSRSPATKTPPTTGPTPSSSVAAPQSGGELLAHSPFSTTADPGSRLDWNSPPTAWDVIARYRLLRPSPKRWGVVSHSVQFGTWHPWAVGGADCPGGCLISWTNGAWGPVGEAADVQ
jgi:hypothetical protein